MAKRKRTIIIPEFVPYDNTLIYKELSEEFGIPIKVVEYVVRTNYKMLRKFINENRKEGDNVCMNKLGTFKAFKSDDTEETKLEKLEIKGIIYRYMNLHITESEVVRLKELRGKGHFIPQMKNIFVDGRRRRKKQLIAPEIRATLPDDYFKEHGAVWAKEPEPMKPEDSVMEKFKDEDYLKNDSEFDVF